MDTYLNNHKNKFCQIIILQQFFNHLQWARIIVIKFDPNYFLKTGAVETVEVPRGACRPHNMVSDQHSNSKI